MFHSIQPWHTISYRGNSIVSRQTHGLPYQPFRLLRSKANVGLALLKLRVVKLVTTQGVRTSTVNGCGEG